MLIMIAFLFAMLFADAVMPALCFVFSRPLPPLVQTGFRVFYEGPPRRLPLRTAQEPNTVRAQEQPQA
jgi:hypothetical protein